MPRDGPEGWCVRGEDRAPRQRLCAYAAGADAQASAGRTRERAGGAPEAALTPGGGGTPARVTHEDARAFLVSFPR